jgi:hypothetical protein
MLFASTEGRMLGLSLALTGPMLLALGLGWHLFPDRILPYAIMTGLNLIIGLEAGMSFGYVSGFGHAQVVPLNILIETIQVLVIYPLNRTRLSTVSTSPAASTTAYSLGAGRPAQAGPGVGLSRYTTCPPSNCFSTCPWASRSLRASMEIPRRFMWLKARGLIFPSFIMWVLLLRARA